MAVTAAKDMPVEIRWRERRCCDTVRRIPDGLKSGDASGVGEDTKYRQSMACLKAVEELIVNNEGVPVLAHKGSTKEAGGVWRKEEKDVS